MVGQSRVRPIRRLSAAVALVPLLLALTSCTKYGATLKPTGDPIVVEGSQAPALIGASPLHIVGFSWDGKVWHQIPIQVDERDWVSPGQILHEPPSQWPMVSGAPYKILVYTTPSWTSTGYRSWDTYTGQDSDPTFDANDQISFIVDDVGQQVPAGTTPPGVDPNEGQGVEIVDPLDTSLNGWVYLYASADLTGDGVGGLGVDYTFSLDSGSYESTYAMGAGAMAPNGLSGPNPEHSTVVTPYYDLAFGDRWLNDGIGVKDDNSPDTPMLEEARFQVASDACAQTESTFDDSVPSPPYEGGFIANIDGPVRAIRSVIGANAGAYTVATDIFYPKSQETTIDLREPAIAGVSLFDDFVTGTPTLAYSDDENSPVPVDGIPDAIVTAHAPAWQMISGHPGSLITSWSTESSSPGLVTSAYELDQSSAVPLPCTGDGSAWGQSGITLTGPSGGGLPCTDPVACAGAPTLSLHRVRYFEEAGYTAAEATAKGARAASPLEVVSG
jgi:hypothetical protein